MPQWRRSGVGAPGIGAIATIGPVTALAALAAAYAFGLARNHPFVDGNKRAAFASIVVFLGLNGIEFDVPPQEATAMILGLASGEIDEEGLTRWIGDRIG